MKTSQNTILITGGSAGIGFEIAKLFAANHNKVIITGRNPERLQKAAAQIPGASAIVCDISNAEQVDCMVEKLKVDFPDLNMIINNAGQAFLYSLSEPSKAFSYASEEMLTNYLSIIRLNEQLLPWLQKQKEAAIVHVSSVVAFTPNYRLATYAASKAALHSYSLSLRIALSRTSDIKVFELMPPLVDTEFSKEIGGAQGISPKTVAEALLNAIEQDEYEIHVGKTAYIYELSRSAPQDALLAMNSVN